MSQADFTKTIGGATVSVKGLSATMRALGKAGADAKDMRAAMHRIGTIVVTAATPRIRTVSGRLASTVRAGRGKTKAVVRAGSARVPYAGVNHYGWPDRHIVANPFLVDALRDTRPKIFQQADHELAQLLSNANLK